MDKANNSHQKLLERFKKVNHLLDLHQIQIYDLPYKLQIIKKDHASRILTKKIREKECI